MGNLKAIFQIFVFACVLGTVFFTSCSILKKNNDPTAKFKDETLWLDYTMLLTEASKQKMLGNFDDSKMLYARALQINPESGVANFELANIYLLKGDNTKSLDHAKKAVKNEPHNMWYKLLEANLYQRTNNIPKATEIFRELKEEYSDKIDFYYNLATLYAYSGKYKKAVETFDECEKRFGVSEVVSLEKEKLYLQMNNEQKAIGEIENLVKAFPTETRYYGILAEAYASYKMYDKALETYKQLLEKDPKNGLVHLSLADFYRIQGDNKKSFDELIIAFGSPDVDVDIKVQMLMNFIPAASMSDSLNKIAYTLLDELVKLHGDDPKVLTLHADYLIQDKKFKEAAEDLKKVVATTKDKYVIWEQLLFVENQLSDYGSMLQTSSEAMELFPMQPLPFLFNGLALHEHKKYDDAIKVLKSGLSLVVDNNDMKVQFYTYLGESYNVVKQYKESDLAFEKLLNIDPENIVAMNNYSYYLSLRGDSLQRAEKMMKKVVEKEPQNATYLDTYAWVLYKAAKYSEAKIQMEKALSNEKTKSAVLVEHYGDILFKLGEKKLAVDQWKAAMAIGKGSDFLEQKVKEERIIE